MRRYLQLHRVLLQAFSLVCCALAAATAFAGPDLQVLFLGDAGHHHPHDRFIQLEPVLSRRGIKLTYTDHVDDLNPKTLSHYDALLIYANIDRIEPAQERALLDYVAGGGGLVPI